VNSSRKVQRPLTEAEMAEVKALDRRHGDVSDFMKPFTPRCTTACSATWVSPGPRRRSTASRRGSTRIPTEQTHEIVGAIGAKIVSISGVQEDIVSWALLWMNSGPSPTTRR